MYILPPPLVESAVCIRDLKKLNLVWCFGFRLKIAFDLNVSKKAWKEVKSDPKMIFLDLEPKFSLYPWYTL